MQFLPLLGIKDLKIVLTPFENGNLMPSHSKGNTLLKNFTGQKFFFENLAFQWFMAFDPLNPASR